MNTDQNNFKHRELTQKVIGIFYEVYNELGHGFLESVYEKAMVIGLRDAGIKAAEQASIMVRFRGELIGDFRADLLIEDLVIVELKAASGLEPAHEAQLLNYLRATDIEVGLLLNFGQKPQFKRLVFGDERKGRPLIHADKRGLTSGMS